MSEHSEPINHEVRAARRRGRAEHGRTPGRRPGEPGLRDRLPTVSRPPAFPAAAYVTLAGADWLASASPHPDSVHTLWAERPTAPSVLPCGAVFDVINAPVLFGRRMVDRLWSAGPGSGPVAVHRGRLLLFAAPGTAQRLPALLAWEEWAAAVPPLLCHGGGDAVTVPALYPRPRTSGAAAEDDPAGATASRWLVAPDVRNPWLPGPDVLLWACVGAARSELAADREGARPHHESAAQPLDTAVTRG
ncbi:bifunctional DNA primase/polymerase [Streptomyces sp. CT34]|uniref:bifunctional DNA primase/polymerase n=1 Tax=Streptomyces sp. CT34 TaxID=1553907 RepID=UPI000B28E20F|nr:bifunctional DNA primase/polymerase [Streptomyces sp. CT34]